MDDSPDFGVGAAPYSQDGVNLRERREKSDRKGLSQSVRALSASSEIPGWLVASPQLHGAPRRGHFQLKQREILYGYS